MTIIQQPAHGDAGLDEPRGGKPISEPWRLFSDCPPRLATSLPRILLGGFVVVWIAAFVPAAGSLLRYEWTAGAMKEAPKTLLQHASFESPALGSKTHSPSGDQAGDPSGDQTGDPAAGLLIVAIHPRCTCTRATLEELEQSAPSWKQSFHAIFLIDQPTSDRGPRFDWHQSATLRQAQTLLKADVIDDEEGHQAARLGALTSGEVLVYSAPGTRGERRLLFSGGVTAGRGMVGENGGLAALEEAVQRSAIPPSVQSRRDVNVSTPADQDVRHSPVYGCGLATLAALAPLQNPASSDAPRTAAPRESAQSAQTIQDRAR